MLSLKISVPEPRPDFRWYVVASGQYNVKTDDLDALCVHPRLVRRSGEVVSCPTDDYRSEDVEYRVGGRVGAVVSGAIHEVLDHEGYDGSASTVISGSSTPAGTTGPIRVEVPFATPPTARIGASVYHAYAPVGPTAVEFGSRSEATRALDQQHRDTVATYADIASGQPLTPMTVDALTFRARPPQGPWQLQWSSPTVTSSDKLLWTTSGGGIDQVSYQVVDPFDQNSLSQRAFAAGVAISLLPATALLLIEQYLAYRRLKPRARRRPRR